MKAHKTISKKIAMFSVGALSLCVSAGTFADGTWPLAAQGIFTDVQVAAQDKPTTTDCSNATANRDLLGQQGMCLFNDIQKNSLLYSYLLALDESVPSFTRQLEYVALLNEVHLANQQLTLILAALQKNGGYTPAMAGTPAPIT